MGNYKIQIVKIVLIIFIFFLGINNIMCQDFETNSDSKPIFKDRFLTGGGFGLQIGTITLINVTPFIAYKITEKFITGLGFIYEYYSDKRFNYKTNIYGGSVFARYYVYKDIFAHGEYEILSYKPSYSIYQNEDRISVENYLLGLGYRQWIGANSSVNFLILWNFNESVYSLYENPVIRISFGIGL